MNTFDKIALSIIKEQELIIGPQAWNEAMTVPGLSVAGGSVSIDGQLDSKAVIDVLVNRYIDLFGRAARETCREAVVGLLADLPESDVPASLK